VLPKLSVTELPISLCSVMTATVINEHYYY